MRVIEMGVASAPLRVATQNLGGCRVVAPKDDANVADLARQIGDFVALAYSRVRAHSSLGEAKSANK